MSAPPTPLDGPALDAAVARDAFLLFKHSSRCEISARAFDRYRAFLRAHPDVPSGYVDVVASREHVRALADRAGVRHQSPQALWFRGGRVAWHASHDAITEASLAAATAGRLAPASVATRAPVPRSGPSSGT